MEQRCVKYSSLKIKCLSCDSHFCYCCDPIDYTKSRCCGEIQCFKCSEDKTPITFLCSQRECNNWNGYPLCSNCKIVCNNCKLDYCGDHVYKFDYDTEEYLCHKCFHECFKMKYGKTNTNTKFLFHRYLAEFIPIIPEIITIIQKYVGEI
jgi:hypothetical protein